MATLISLPFETSFETENVNGKSSKSSAFKLVETALKAYVVASTESKLLELTKALGDWKLTKADDQAHKNWTDSVRGPAVKKLSHWLIKESEAQGIFPTSRALWSHKHNCYAYAMKCQEPKGLGQIAWTGKLAKKRIGQDYPQGVIEDGLAQNVRVVNLNKTLPTPVPPPLSDGSYLVAMVSNGNGFHFLRRRESTGLWTHKNGGGSPVDTHFYDRSIEQPLAITDAVVARILTNPKLIGCDMTFTAYMRVPSRGMKVKGGDGDD
jgi:hypothetical protein